MDLQTRSARVGKINERRAAKELNNIGKRLIWLRSKLNITQKDVSEATEIPKSSYCDRESGVRTEYLEEYIVLAIFFDGLWQDKYEKKGNYPEYLGERLVKITQVFIMYGSDEAQKSFENEKSELKAKIFELQRDNLKREEELKRKLDLFRAG